jgi:hypothetical protein
MEEQKTKRLVLLAIALLSTPMLAPVMCRLMKCGEKTLSPS